LEGNPLEVKNVIEDIISKIKNSLENSGFDAVLVFGYDNVQYLSGAYLYFPPSYPDRYISIFWSKNDEPVAILPHEWESSFLNLSWINKTKTYIEKPGSPSSIAEVAANLAKNSVRRTGKIGIDIQRTSVNLFNRLENALEDFEVGSCDIWLRNLRITKTPKELDLLEKISYKIDHAIAGQAHHVLVKQASTEMSNTENLRVHALERELDEVGQNSIAQVSTGDNSTKFWPYAPKYGIGYDRVPIHHEIMRMELWGTQNGYWSYGARLLTMGEPTDNQIANYDGLVALREIAQKNIKPGISCKQIYEIIKSTAAEKGIKILPNLTLGSGIGVSDREPPYLSAADETELLPGMILLLRLVIKGPNDELIMNNDTIIVTDEGSKIVGWYKDWRRPFIANYTY
jgi:Xaa-Pro aminopeptidase